MTPRTETAAATLAAGVALTLSACAADPITPDAPTGQFRDGEYTATGWYGSLPSHHDVTVTVLHDAVTPVEISTPAEDETSLGYQQRFADALPAAVIGQPLDEIVVDKLAGASGCSEGLMNALEQIRAEARG